MISTTVIHGFMSLAQRKRTLSQERVVRIMLVSSAALKKNTGNVILTVSITNSKQNWCNKDERLSSCILDISWHRRDTKISRQEQNFTKSSQHTIYAIIIGYLLRINNEDDVIIRGFY